MSDVNGLHHVGHLVRDLDHAMDLYRRLGFTVPPPAYPVLPRVPGGPAEPFGVANTHVYFPRNFIELVAVIDETSQPPGQAHPIPLQAPDDELPELRAAIGAAAANLASFLERSEGIHILIADTPDIDSVAARLAAAGVSHGGVHAIQRPIETDSGTRMEPARYLEISSDAGPLPEGRIGLAENTSAVVVEDQRHLNGATELTECVLCVPDSALAEFEQRYRTYFGEARANVTILPASALAGRLPGERPAALPAFAAYAVSVRDIAATERLLRDNDLPIVQSGAGELFVPSGAALGTAIIFRQKQT